MDSLYKIHDIHSLASRLLALVSHDSRDFVRLAADFAIQAHAPQQRKDGSPYILHPLRVAIRLAEDGYTHKDLLASALLHDVIEDCEVTKEDLLHTFNNNVAETVELLTKSKGEEESYFAVLTQSSENAKLVKIYDRLDNLATMHPFSPEKKQQYIRETKQYFFDLAQFDHGLQNKLKEAVAQW